MAIYTGRNEDSSGNILLSIGNGMTATLETGTTASQAYTKGAYVFFNNRLCKATTAIASGATLAIGTNLAQTSIGAELTSHLRSSDAKEFYFDVKDGSYGFYPSASKVASEFVPFGGTSSLQYVVQTGTNTGTLILDHNADLLIYCTSTQLSSSMFYTVQINGVTATLTTYGNIGSGDAGWGTCMFYANGNFKIGDVITIRSTKPAYGSVLFI